VRLVQAVDLSRQEGTTSCLASTSPTTDEAVATASKDGTVKLWQVEAGALLATLRRIAQKHAEEVLPMTPRPSLPTGDHWRFATATCIFGIFFHPSTISCATRNLWRLMI
jgi:hypothetical protein